MPHFRTLMAWMLALCAAPAALAATTQFEISSGEPMRLLPGTYTYDWGWQGPAYLTNAQGRIAFQGSEWWVGAMNVLLAETTAVPPADMFSADADAEPNALAVRSPLQSFGGEVDDSLHTFAFDRFSATGGMQITTSAQTVSRKPNRFSTGGSVVLSNLTIDMTSREVRADVLGGNNVGVIAQVPIWQYRTVTGATVAPLQYAHVDHLFTQLTLGDLGLTEAGLDVLSRSLGLTSLGHITLSGDLAWGSVYVTASAQLVPEPASAALMALGLAGVAVATSRRQRHAALLKA